MMIIKVSRMRKDFYVKIATKKQELEKKDDSNTNKVEPNCTFILNLSFNKGKKKKLPRNSQRKKKAR